MSNLSEWHHTRDDNPAPNEILRCDAPNDPEFERHCGDYFGVRLYGGLVDGNECPYDDCSGILRWATSDEIGALREDRAEAIGY